MFDNINAAYLQLMTLLSFGFSVVAAVLAIDMYRLLRTAAVGQSWRIMCVASVLFAFTLALRLAENFGWGELDRYHLSRFSEVFFVLGMAYAFYLQRRAFSHRKEAREQKTVEDEENPAAPEPDLEELDELTKYYAEGGKARDSVRRH